MLSHIVTAAKGLFTRPDSDETSSTNPPEIATSNMVTATRQRNVTGEEMPAESDINSIPITNGKRKSRAVNSGKATGQHSKRRKQSSIEENGESDIDKERSPGTEEQADTSVKKNHVKFGSEEPEEPVDIPVEGSPEPQQNGKADGDESSDDDAPEAIDNSAQMSKIKAEAQKLQQAKQRFVPFEVFDLRFNLTSYREIQLKKEKRKQIDERRKLQAKLANRKPDTDAGDDLVSESTETLQGSTTHESRRNALPALLPDEILNSAPAARPPTPPAEGEDRARKPNKLKFLDKVDKPAKDVKMDDVTIRVLDEPSSRKKNKPALPPKISRVGRNSRENWLKSRRSTASVNGLRRTAGGAASSGFVRK